MALKAAGDGLRASIKAADSQGVSHCEILTTTVHRPRLCPRQRSRWKEKWSGYAGRRTPRSTTGASRMYIPVEALFQEDIPPVVGRTVRVQLPQGKKARVWKGVVEEVLAPPSALELALPAKRTASQKQKTETEKQQLATKLQEKQQPKPPKSQRRRNLGTGQRTRQQKPQAGEVGVGEGEEGIQKGQMLLLQSFNTMLAKVSHSAPSTPPTISPAPIDSPQPPNATPQPWQPQPADQQSMQQSIQQSIQQLPQPADQSMLQPADQQSMLQSADQSLLQPADQQSMLQSADQSLLQPADQSMLQPAYQQSSGSDTIIPPQPWQSYCSTPVADEQPQPQCSTPCGENDMYEDFSQTAFTTLVMEADEEHALYEELSSCPPSPAESLYTLYSCTPSPLPTPLPPLPQQSMPRPRRTQQQSMQPHFPTSQLPQPPHQQQSMQPHFPTSQLPQPADQPPQRKGRKLKNTHEAAQRPTMPPPQHSLPTSPLGRRLRMQQHAAHFSPLKSVEEILSRHVGESNAGRAAVRLAVFYFFGVRTLTNSTAGTLDPVKMRRIKEIILAKHGAKRCPQDRDILWEKCKKAIGQKCNHLRMGQRQGLKY